MTASVKATAAAGREEFSERLLKGSVKKSYAPDRRHRLGRPAGSGQVLPATQDGVAVRHAAVGQHDPRATDRAVAAGARQHAVGRHLVREHPQPGAAAQDDAPGPHRPCHALRTDRTRRRDPPHGHVRQGDRAGRREAGAAQAVSANDHQRAAARLQGFAAVGSGADRRGDLRLAAAPDDGRSRPAANGPAPHAHSRHRGGPPHPVCPRRVAQARPAHAADQQVVGGQPQRLGGLFFQYLFTNPVPYRRVGLDARGSPPRRSQRARIGTRCRSPDSRRWQHFSRRSG